MNASKYRIRPRAEYNGLTIILSSPTRFDIQNTIKTGQHKLFIGNAGSWFTSDCLPRNGISLASCDIRIADADDEPFIKGTRVVLCLGAVAQTVYMGTNASLGAQRGSPVVSQESGLIFISSFTPQDCFDPKNHEGKYREQQHDDEDSWDHDTEEYSDEKSHHGKTKRLNFRAWLESDVRKVAFALKNKLPLDDTEIIFDDEDPCSRLREANGTLFIDIETAPDLSIRCFGWCLEEGPVYVVRVMDHNDTMRPDWVRILLTLVHTARRCSVVMHNGSTFDIPVFMWRYGLPLWPKEYYDTMVAQHRTFPFLEKSLGHCGSMWTFEPYHKNDGDYNPTTLDRDIKNRMYCGRDISLMRLVWKKQRIYAAKVKGMPESIAFANEASLNYMLDSFVGAHVDETRRKAMQLAYDHQAILFRRIAEILVGPEIMALVKKPKSKSSLVASSDMLRTYFHEIQKYPIVAYTDGGQSKLGEVELYKLALKLDNKHPIIQLTLAYRAACKSSSDLNTTPFYRNFVEWKKAQPNEGNLCS